MRWVFASVLAAFSLAGAAPVALASEQHPTPAEIENEIWCNDCKKTLAEANNLTARDIRIYLYGLIAISAIVQIGLALPMVIYFHRIGFSGLSANAVIVPLFEFLVRFVALFPERGQGLIRLCLGVVLITFRLFGQFSDLRVEVL